MKNISYVINGILAVAIIILFILFFTSKSKCTESAPLAFAANDSTAMLPVAYVNVDSLLINYNFAKDANDRLMKKVNSTETTLANKQRQIQAEESEFNRKAQNNAFLSQERAEQEATRIRKMAMDFQQMAQRMQNELGMEQQKMTIQISDSVKTCIERYNKTANYQIIFMNNGHDNIIVAKDKYDITNKILSILNDRYIPETKK